ncbi:MAG: alpha/beta fold hydrolase [Chloroflexota bacterium]
MHNEPAPTTHPDHRHRYIATNGTYLHTVQAGPEDAPLVILLHGFPEFWRGWQRQLPALAGAGWCVWAPDQRGYNLSDKPRGLDAYTPDVLAADVKGLIKASGRRSVVLVGHDWGGVIAWWTALNDPQLVQRLVIVNAPHPGAMRHHLLHNPLQQLRSAYAAFFQLPWLPELVLGAGNGLGASLLMRLSSRPGVFPAERLHAYRRAWQRPRALHSMLNWYRALRRTTPSRPASERVSRPTLIIWGRRDIALGPALARLSIQMCDDGRLVYIDEASHWVQHEQAPRVNKLLLDFMGRP